MNKLFLINGKKMLLGWNVRFRFHDGMYGRDHLYTKNNYVSERTFCNEMVAYVKNISRLHFSSPITTLFMHCG